jgi:hypothetical protein
MALTHISGVDQVTGITTGEGLHIEAGYEKIKMSGDENTAAYVNMERFSVRLLRDSVCVLVSDFRG